MWSLHQSGPVSDKDDSELTKVTSLASLELRKYKMYSLSHPIRGIDLPYRRTVDSKKDLAIKEQKICDKNLILGPNTSLRSSVA